MNITIDHVLAQWARAGAGFNIEHAGGSPDLERLLLNTARCAPHSARLFTLAATWLSAYGHLVARHRLRQLVVNELNDEDAAALGLLLDIVREKTDTRHFNTVILACRPAVSPHPLFNAEKVNDLFHARAQRRASDISRRWNLWVEPIELKRDAVHSAFWIARTNPVYQDRADFCGDLRCSILETLRHDPHAGASELELARNCGATRMAVRSAIEKLALAGRIERPAVTGRKRPVILAASAA
jgi:hypothetical protein